MLKFFGLPIILAIILGCLFPFNALILMPYGFFFLFILMLSASLSVDFKQFQWSDAVCPEMLLALAVSYLIMPVCQLFLAKIFIEDRQLLMGIYLSALSPVAIVAPYFVGVIGGKKSLAYVSIILSSALFPIMLLLGQLLFSEQDMNPFLKPMLLNLVFLVLLPIAISLVVVRFLPHWRELINPYLGQVNSWTLSLLIFIFFGSAFGKINIQFFSNKILAGLVVVAFFQDYGAYFLQRWLFRRVFDRTTADSLALSHGMKNVALTAGLLLFIDPKAAIPATTVFIAHAFFFNNVAFFQRAKTLDA